MNTLATIKRIANATTPEAAAAFFNIHLRGLRGFPLVAIQAAVDYFCYEDERREGDKNFFPLPDELLRETRQQLELLEHRVRAAERLKRAQENTIMLAPPVAEPEPPDPYAHFSKTDVMRACKLIMGGASLEDAHAQVAREIEERNQAVQHG